jgi:hypothetical protein
MNVPALDATESPNGSRLRRAGLVSMLDQAFSSATNFGLAGSALLLLPDQQFALFSIVQASYVLLLSVIRAMYLEPLLLRSRERIDAPADGGSTVMVGSVLMGLVLGGVMMAVASWWLDEPRLGLILLVGFPLLALNEALRYEAMHRLAMTRALVIDASWALITFPAIVVIWLTDRDAIDLHLLVIVWIAGAAIPALILATRWAAAARTAEPVQSVRRQSHLVSSLLLDNVVAQSATSLMILAVSLFMSRTELARFAAPRTVLGVINFVFVGAVAFGMAASRSLPPGSPAARRFHRLLSIGLPAAALAVAGVAVAAAPWVARVAPASSVSALRLQLALIGGAVACAGYGHAQRVALRVGGDSRGPAVVQLRIGLALIVGSTLGAWIGGPLGGSIGWFGASLVGLVLWRSAVRRLVQGNTPEKPTTIGLTVDPATMRSD